MSYYSKKNHFKKLKIFLFIYIILSTLNFIILYGDNKPIIYFTIESITNKTNDFEYDYIKNLLKKLLINSLENKEIKLTDQLRELYVDNFLNKISYKFNSLSDFNFPIKTKYSLIEILNSSNGLLKFNNKKAILKIFITYNYDDNFKQDNILLNFSFKILFNKVLLNKFTFKIEYDPFKIYEQLKNVSEKFIIEKITFLKYSKLKIISDKSYFVKIDSVVVGRTNEEFILKNGIHEIEIFYEGYKTLKTFLELKEDKEIKIKLKKLKTKPYIIINSFPQNSEVYINNKYYGNTPLVIKNISYGTYFLRIYHKNFEVKEVIINIDQTSSVELYYYLNVKNYQEFYLSWANTYLNLGYSNAFMSGVFAGVGIISYMIFSDLIRKYLITNDQNYLYLSYTTFGISILSTGIASYYFIISLLDLLTYFELIKNYLNE